MLKKQINVVVSRPVRLNWQTDCLQQITAVSSRIKLNDISELIEAKKEVVGDSRFELETPVLSGLSRHGQVGIKDSDSSLALTANILEHLIDIGRIASQLKQSLSGIDIQTEVVCPRSSTIAVLMRT